jgi:hypothetical protein
LSTKTLSPKSLPDEFCKIQQGKTALHEFHNTLEDLDDRRELARAKKRNGDNPGTDWKFVKKEFGFHF